MAAEYRLESCGKGTRPEGLGDEVVGTELEYSHFVVLVSFGGKHHDGNVFRGRPRANLLQDLVAVEPGKVEVEDDHVGRLTVDLIQSLDPIPGLDDGISLTLQQVLHHAAQRLFVLDQQDAGADAAGRGWS